MSNVRKTSFSELKKLLPAYLKAKHPVMLWSAPGEGKSGFVRGMSKELGYDLQDFRLLMRDPVDIHGIPRENENKRLAWCFPEEIPLATDDIQNKRIMFFDELPAAQTSVQTIAYQMFHERMVDNVHLHDNVHFIAAGNDTNHSAVSNRMPSALANRMAHFWVEADSDSWSEWAIKSSVNPMVTGFIQSKPEALRAQKDSEYNEKRFKSPRAWEYVSDTIHHFTHEYNAKSKLYTPKESLSDNDYWSIQQIAASFVGEAAALDFTAFTKLGDKLPSLKDICNGKVKVKNTLPLDQQYYLANSLLSYLAEFRNYLKNNPEELAGSEYHKHPQFTKYVDNVLEYVAKAFTAESISTFITRFLRSEYYQMTFNCDSEIQKAWFKKVTKQEGDEFRLVMAKY